MFTNRVYGLVSLCLIKSINDTWPSHSFFIEHEKALSALPIFGKSLFIRKQVQHWKVRYCSSDRVN